MTARSIVAVLFVFVALVLPARADDVALTAEIKARVNELNQAFVDRNTVKIESMVTADQIAIIPEYGKPISFADRLVTFDQYSVVKSDFTPIQVTVLGPAAVLVTYENSNQGSYAGKPLSPRVFVSQTWVMQDGKWLQERYQETPIAGK